MDLLHLSLEVFPWAWASGAALFVAYFALLEIWSSYRLSHVPGPFWAGWSVYPMLRRAQTGRYYEEMIKLWREYGMWTFAWHERAFIRCHADRASFDALKDLW
jgi:hypothetical protein